MTVTVQAKMLWSNGRIAAIETRGDLLHATLYSGADDLTKLGAVVLWRGTSDRLSRIVEMTEIEATRKEANDDDAIAE